MLPQNNIKENWYLPEEDAENSDYSLKEYDITASPNDFNIKTIFDFIESGVVKIPAFQRNYVWDLKRASKLIESIIIGIPVPQIFLYEESRNSFLVIDGQQRLMSIYYFIKQRFPRNIKRAELRKIFDEQGKIPDEVLHDDEYFEKFNLHLPHHLPGQTNKLNQLNYSTLDEYKTGFDLRTIRNIIVKQNMPANDDSSVYEIFNRLNSGGINLTAQEIRASLYHSNFYTMLNRINAEPRWRKIVGLEEPDLNMKDIEILLRGFAMLLEGDKYKPSMTKFLNSFSQNCKSCPPDKIAELEGLFSAFLDSCSNLDEKAFYGRNTPRFNISIFESVFAAVGQCLDIAGTNNSFKINPMKLQQLKDDSEFFNATQYATASKDNVATRLRKSSAILMS